ncbi:MAG: DNA adenine methylase [Burkholderiaceae bacterium]|nr:MAG: DNA adenine methylase [Burkholderiaceae bacterium]
MSAVTKPLLRYHGAKFRLAQWITSFFPPHMTYVEPFGGSAGVLLQKPRAYAEIYNDLDDDVVNLFRILRDPELARSLVAMLELTPYARTEFQLAYEASSDPLERARRTVIRAGMGFGSAGATKGSTGFRVDTRRRYGTAQKLWSVYPERLAPIVERLSGVMIENRPALDVIEQHDSTETLFYIDPPYVLGTRKMQGGQTGYYRFEMTDEDHVALLERLQTVHGMVVLSAYPHPMYDGLLSGWTRYTTTARIAGGRGGALRTECAWLNPACAEALASEDTPLFSKTACP